MALYRWIVRATMGSGAPADVATWTHGVSLSSVPSGSDLGDMFATAMLSTVGGTALRVVTPGYALRVSVELAPAAGGASVAYQALSGQLGIGSSPLPTQVAMPIIGMVSGPRGPRAGARWMIGPMAGGSSNGRPTAQQQNGCVSYLRSLHAQLAAFGGGLVVLRDGGTASEPVTHLVASNAFGTVGRRRLEVTARTLVAI